MWRLEKGNAFLSYVSVTRLQAMYGREKNARAKLRLLAAIRRKKGESIDDISSALEIPRRTIHGWLTRFEQRRLGAVHNKKQTGRPAKLTNSQLKKLRRELLKGPAHVPGRLWTTRHVREHLKKGYNIVYRRSNVFRLLHSLGFTLQEPRQQHYKSDKIAQDRFKKKLGESASPIGDEDGRLRVWMNARSTSPPISQEAGR
jgi:transposase